MAESSLENSGPLTEEELSTLVDLLKRVPNNGFLPLELFYAIAERYVTTIVELIPYAIKDGVVYVLLTRRAEDDPYWPNMLHTPGTVVRKTDITPENDYKSAIDRIIDKELGNIPIVEEPVWVMQMLHKVNRGVESSQIVSLQIPYSESPRVGKFFPLSELPVDIVDHQVGFIHRALDPIQRSSNEI